MLLDRRQVFQGHLAGATADLETHRSAFAAAAVALAGGSDSQLVDLSIAYEGRMEQARARVAKATESVAMVDEMIAELDAVVAHATPTWDMFSFRRGFAGF